jgi:hypothetical protein
VPPESGSHALWLLTGAAALYVLSQLFAAWQLIIQEQQGGPRRTPPDPYGARQELYVLLGLLPTYVAACLASIVLIGAPMLDGWVIGKFALVGALVIVGHGAAAFCACSHAKSETEPWKNHGESDFGAGLVSPIGRSGWKNAHYP